MTRHHSLCNDGSIVATEGKACQMALAVSFCYCQFDWLMALLMSGSSPTPTAMFASCVIIRTTKGCVSHFEAEEACKEPIPPSLTRRNPSSCSKNYISHSNCGGRPLCALWINTLSASSLGQSWTCHVTLFFHHCLRKQRYYLIVASELKVPPGDCVALIAYTRSSGLFRYKWVQA